MRNLALMWVLAVCLLGCGGDKGDKNKAAQAADTVATFTDTRDGKVYRIVEIGSQTWFAENLNYAAEGSKCYGEGGQVIIGYNKYDKAIITTLSNVEVQANCAKYGRLYDWETALTACPAGTHLPTDEEWTRLADYVGGWKTAGTKLKSSTGWGNYKNVPAVTDEYGFSALPGGFRTSGGRFYDAGGKGFWWSATEYNVSNAWYRNMHYCFKYVNWYNYYKTNLISVRCVQDKDGTK